MFYRSGGLVTLKRSWKTTGRLKIFVAVLLGKLCRNVPAGRAGF